LAASLTAVAGVGAIEAPTAKATAKPMEINANRSGSGSTEEVCMDPRLFMLSIFALLTPGAALSDAPMQQTIKYYDVSGSTAQEIREDLDRQGPRGENGRRFDAHTRWTVNWKYRSTPANGLCSLVSFDTEVRVTMQMPRWGGADAASVALLEAWETYEVALMDHERGHQDLAVSAAAEMRRQVLDLSDEQTCSRLGVIVEEVAQAVLREYRERERDYDAQTNHGETQGANFPLASSGDASDHP